MLKQHWRRHGGTWLAPPPPIQIGAGREIRPKLASSGGGGRSSIVWRKKHQRADFKV